MMALSGVKIAVIGAGIGGLAVARALAMQGAQVMVLEQTDTIREVGAGIQISPNGFAVLRALGVGQKLQSCAIQAQAVNLIDYRGKAVARLDLQKLETQDYYFLHRADLINVLAKAAQEAGVRIRTNYRAERVVDGRIPEIHLNDKTIETADWVIGADGIHSVVRPTLSADSKPFFTGQVAWRAVVPVDNAYPPEVRLFMGPGRHMVCYPLRNGTMMNVVAVQEQKNWVPVGWNHQDDPENLRQVFSDFCPEVSTLLDRINTVYLWGLFRTNVAPEWHGKRIALLGDAAHPMLPFMAQGASMALEDAWVLADSLSHGAGLADYQSRRQLRVSKVVKTADNNTWKYHLSNSPLRWAAHTGLNLASRTIPGTLLHQFDWIYEHDVTIRSQL